jgi:hypothetical protein
MYLNPPTGGVGGGIFTQEKRRESTCKMWKKTASIIKQKEFYCATKNIQPSQTKQAGINK